MKISNIRTTPIPSAERDLVSEAIRRAGNQKALAKMFDVAQSAISEWGRTRPIPRHVKPRLEDYLKPDRAAALEGVSVASSRSGDKALPAKVNHLLHLLRLDLAGSRIAELPRRYRKQYENRVEETITRVTRELEEYQVVLEAEHRRGRNKKGRGGSREAALEK